MLLRWMSAHDGAPVEYAFDDAVRVAQIVHYDVVAGEGPGWVGFVRGRTVTGRSDEPEQARSMVAEFYAKNPDHGRAPPKLQRD